MRDGESGGRERKASVIQCRHRRPQARVRLFVATGAAEPVSSRMRSEARPGGDRGTPCGKQEGATSYFMSCRRGARSG